MSEGSKDEGIPRKVYITGGQGVLSGFGKGERVSLPDGDTLLKIAQGRPPDDIARNIDKPAKRKK